MKKILFFLVIGLTLAYLLCFPAQAFAASASGLTLWFHTVLPSLLPFLILSDFLIHTGRIPRLLKHFQGFFARFLGLDSYGAYACVLGLFCGYPMGAKLTADLVREQKISLAEAKYLLAFSNNASPMFLSSYVLLNTLDAREYTFPTFFILYAADMLTALHFRIKYHPLSPGPAPKKGNPARENYSGGSSRLKAKSPENTDKKKEAPGGSLSRLIDVSIMNGFETITRLGGYIILFSIGASMIVRLTRPFPLLGWILPGLVEITTGIHQAASSPLPFEIRYLLILVFTAFGGLSAAAQTKGMLSGTPLSLKHYLPGKLIHAAWTLVLGILFLFFLRR